MPEIKHQFTAGKMNKDLDERLIQNGQYRDAMNIQVSTSEGSDVGTIQNILGNSLVPGQGFIKLGAHCVGSIADEKNDKLYYFITHAPFFKEDFHAQGLGWTVNDGNTSANTAWTFSAGSAKAAVDGYGYMTFTVPEIVEGDLYTITYDIADDNGGGSFILANHGVVGGLGTNGTDNNVRLIGEGTVGTYSVDWLQGSSNVGKIRLYNSTTFEGRVDNISVSMTAGDYIIEYDSKTNSITPVLVDTTRDVLQFSSDRPITGINIIDDMLFWTDNYSEPKKINITRSIEGTDSSGLIHTNFINEKTSGFVSIEEKHITVIKQAPSIAPTITMNTQRDVGKTYTGVMRITEPFIGASTNNVSSFNDGSNNSRFDFSGLNVGDYITHEIETDINGNSGFSLDWNPGDTILYKEYIDGLQAPPTPITNYTIKAVIEDYILNSTTLNRFTDQQTQEVLNGDFTTPNSSGNFPDRFTGSGGVLANITYNSALNRLEWNMPYLSGQGWQTIRYIRANNQPNWDDGSTPSTYRVAVNISGYVEGKIRLWIVSGSTDNNGDYYRWATGNINTDGVSTFDITTDVTDLTNAPTSWSTYANSFLVSTSSSNSGFVGNIESISIINLNADNARISAKITDIIGTPTKVTIGDNELRYAVDRQDNDDRLYEFKFPRFATRYKYQDGEYSVFSPFTPVAFLPGSFDYDPVQGYNIGMTNRLTSVDLKINNNTFPDGVVLIDILYKEDTSPNVYVLDSIKPNNWSDTYSVTSETINRVVPSNQFLRPWDNVPKKALAQDTTGGRIVYANYEQGYDLIDQSGDEYYPDIEVNFESNNINKTKKSVKSSREYQVGVAFVDKYGRETPVVAGQSSASNAKKLNKLEADKQNKINVTFNSGNFMKDAKFFKFFVKETSGEYYNMAMDRYWDAEDGHIWVSFPSSDVNKIDIDSYLVLKKGVNSNNLVKDPARYKVIAIENEAPDFIKTKKALIDEKQHVEGVEATDVFGNALLAKTQPIAGENEFKLKYTPFLNSAGSNIDLNDDGGIFYIEFTDTFESFVSNRYKINEIDTNWRHQSVDPLDAAYFIKLDENLGTDVDFINDGTKIKDDTIVRIYKYKKENSPEFDGRFFVKIKKDITFSDNAYDNLEVAKTYRVAASKKLYYLKNDIGVTHSEVYTGLSDGMYAYSSASEGGLFGRYAPFFRNYKHKANDEQIEKDGTLTDVGQYKFGEGDDWKTEFLQYTSSGGAQQNGWAGAWNYTSNSSRIFTKIADQYPNASSNEEEVWFIDAGIFKGSSSGSNGNNLDWDNISQGNGTKTGIVNQTSITSPQATLSLAIGGVYNSEISTDSDRIVNDFFAIGQSVNTFYDDTNAASLVSNLNSSVKFRFKEDPQQTMYTIQSFTDSRLMRYGDGKDGSNFPWNSGTNSSYQKAQLSPNFTKGWNLKIKNEDGNGKMSWDPTGSLGSIQEDGISLRINHSSAASTVANPEIAVVVDSLNGTATDGSSQIIKVGMALFSHSDGAKVFSASNNHVTEDPLVIWKIEEQSSRHVLYLTGYKRLIDPSNASPTQHRIFYEIPAVNQEMHFVQPRMNGYSQFSANRINQQSAYHSIESPGLYAVGYTIEFLQEIEGDSELPDNPAIWETEPKESTPLDIYYEASGLNPIVLQEDTKHLAIPLGSIVTYAGDIVSISEGTTVQSVGFETYNTTPTTPASSGWYISVGPADGVVYSGGDPIVGGTNIIADSILRITKPDGSSVDVMVSGWEGSGPRANKIFIGENIYQTKHTLNWHNCFSFGNGVESNRVRDNFNLPFVSNGARVSTVLEDEEDYKSDHRKSGLIYSGVYNGISGVNNLNQFIAAEKITKDLNPTYGSIQKLHSRDSDLIALCEDKVVQILADKDAVFEADGNPQLIATNRVLGQSRPFAGEYGISNNPESFASESYRAYFTDRVRGAVMRLSKDGLTPISEHGMKDWFKDNLSIGTTNLLGENNLSSEDNWDIPSEGNSAVINGEAILGYYNADEFVNDARWGKVASFKMLNVLEIGKTYRLQFDVIEHSGLVRENNGDNRNITVNNTPSGGSWAGIPGMNDSKIDGNHVNVTWKANRTSFELLHYQVNSRHDFDVDSSGGTPTNVLDSNGDVVLYEENITGYYGGSTYSAVGTTMLIDDYRKTIDPNAPAWSGPWLYGGTVRIKNLILEEVKEDLKITGSYDDKQDEYNVTIHGANTNTVTFKENAKGWVSFKSFTPENAISCANDYYTMKDGKLWQHHNPGVNRNTFYGEFNNSSFNAILNDMPSSIKSYHTLEYEGSQGKILGVKTLKVTGVEYAGGANDGRYFFFEESEANSFFNQSDSTVWGASGSGTSSGNPAKALVMKQYRNNTLIYRGLMMLWGNYEAAATSSPSGGPTKGFGRRTAPSGGFGTVSNLSDFEVGDVITTQLQEDSVNAIGSNSFNSTSVDGWYVSSIETNKEKGSLPEFIEKEGKWFNYIKGVDQAIDNDQIQDYSQVDFSSFDVQGLGVVYSIDGNEVVINGDVNASLQVDDIVYHSVPSVTLDPVIDPLAFGYDVSALGGILDSSLHTSGYHADYNSNLSTLDGFVVGSNPTDKNKATWTGGTPVIDFPIGKSYLNEIATEELIVGQTYLGTLEISGYSGTGKMGLSPDGGISSELSTDGSTSSPIKRYFVATTAIKPSIFGMDTNAGDMTFSIQKVIENSNLGFTRVDSGQLQKAGKVLSINGNTITLNGTAGLAVHDYCMFIKNQVINMNGLSGYYADVMFENDSKLKAELFSVSSEITESSK